MNKVGTIPVPNIGSVITELLEKAGITEADLAKAIDLPRATINRIHAGKIAHPRSSTLTLIANYFNITIDQLLGYSTLQNDYTSNKINVIQIPQLSWEIVKKQANHIDKAISNESTKPVIVEMSSDQCNANNMFALKVTGDAMWPYFDDNSIIAIDTKLIPDNRNFVIAYLASTNEVILRQLFIDGSTKILKAINPIFDVIRLGNDDFIIGVVSYVKKNLL